MTAEGYSPETVHTVQGLTNELLHAEVEPATHLPREKMSLRMTGIPVVDAEPMNVARDPEHLPEAQLALAFQHLLQVTRHRLMVAVPYETEATRAYGHEHVFTRATLERWGKWCVESLDGAARFWCEEVAGGLPVIDRSAD